jgi:hypothetical protein
MKAGVKRLMVTNQVVDCFRGIHPVLIIVEQAVVIIEPPILIARKSIIRKTAHGLWDMCVLENPLRLYSCPTASTQVARH